MARNPRVPRPKKPAVDRNVIRLPADNGAWERAYQRRLAERLDADAYRAAERSRDALRSWAVGILIVGACLVVIGLLAIGMNQ